MINFKSHQREELWRTLMNACDLILDSEKNKEPCKAVSEVSPKYSCSVELSGKHIQLQLLKYNPQTKLNSDLIHEIEIRLDVERDSIFFRSHRPFVKTNYSGLSSGLSVSEMTSSQLANSVTQLVNHIPTVELVERFNSGLQSFMWSKEYFNAAIGKK
jgi:hypothetical protein